MKIIVQFVFYGMRNPTGSELLSHLHMRLPTALKLLLKLFAFSKKAFVHQDQMEISNLICSEDKMPETT